MPGLFIFLVISLAVICMVLATSRFNQHPFIALMVIAIAVDPVCKIPVEEVISTVKSGFGSILASVGIIILAGTIIGTVPEGTGATLTVASATLKLAGKKNSILIMAVTGYATDIPVFCNFDSIILSPISRALASQSNVPLAVMATTLSGGSYTTHCLVPPTPGPIVMAGILGVDLGLTILVSLLVSILTTLSALFYAKRVSGKVDIPVSPEYTVDELLQKYDKLPGAFHSLSPILLPIVLIAPKSVGDFPSAPFGDGVVGMLFSFVGSSVIALILSVFLVMTLVLAAERKGILSWIAESIINSTGILAITGVGGTFKVILQKLSITDTLSAPLLGLGVGVFLPFIITTLLKTAMGASIVAMTTISAMIAPLMSALGSITPLVKVLVIMVIGVGSIIVSHANDSCFQVVFQFSDAETKNAYRCQTGMTGVISTVTIIVVFMPSLVFYGVHS